MRVDPPVLKVSPLDCLRGDPAKLDAPSAPGAHDEGETKAERGIFCATCQTWIAAATPTVAPLGDRCRFVFANPAGRLFEIVTLSEASNVFVLGEATHEHTWFPGFSWRVLVCAACAEHLGWRFDGGGASFVALITTAVVEG